MQPAVDKIVFEKMWIGTEDGQITKIKVLLAISARIYLETAAIVMFARPAPGANQEWSVAGMVYLVVIAPPMIAYLFRRNIGMSYMSEVMYRIMTAIIIISIFWAV